MFKEVITIRNRPTIQMVADKAGVSRGTVDRVLNNRSHVSPEIYERVLDAIKETGYIPVHKFHQITLQNSTHTPIKLGVLLPNWTGHFKAEILRGIEAARTEFESFRVEILTEECETNIPHEIIERIDRLVSDGIQGLSLCTFAHPVINARINSLIEQGIPVVTYNSDLPDSRRLLFFGQDYPKSGRIAAELLSKCVSENAKILVAIGSKEFDGHRQRLRGFHERMRELGFGDSQFHLIETLNDYQITYRKVLRHLEEMPDTNAVYMVNRSVSGCSEAVRTAGKKGKLRIICHDLPESTKFLLRDGSIDFTITQDIYQQGYLPLAFLREYLQKKIKPDSFNITSRMSIICSQNIEG